MICVEGGIQNSKDFYFKRTVYENLIFKGLISGHFSKWLDNCHWSTAMGCSNCGLPSLKITVVYEAVVC